MTDLNVLRDVNSREYLIQKEIKNIKDYLNEIVANMNWNIRVTLSNNGSTVIHLSIGVESYTLSDWELDKMKLVREKFNYNDMFVASPIREVNKNEKFVVKMTKLH